LRKTAGRQARRLDVLLTPGELLPGDVAGRTAVVIDVLRATSTVVQALGSGARAIFPVSSIEEALKLANTLGREEVLLCGERRALPIEGFDLGNSPGDFTRKRVAGKTLVMSTTNGTALMTAATTAERVVIASFLNLSAVVADLVRSEGDAVLLCSGREGKFALEDAVCAGKIAAGVMAARGAAWTLNDGATAALALAKRFTDLPALLPTTGAGQQIVEAELEGDLGICARIDLHAIVPVLQDRQITLPAAES
jgi:2-phosphosulfolactate phosphatase